VNRTNYPGHKHGRSPFKSDNVTAAQLAVDSQVEERKISLQVLHLQLGPDRPNVALSEKWLCDQLAFVPRRARTGVSAAHADTACVMSDLAGAASFDVSICMAATEFNHAQVRAPRATKHAMPLGNGGSCRRAARLPQVDAALESMDRHGGGPRNMKYASAAPYPYEK
jgi:hypothetical protein